MSARAHIVHADVLTISPNVLRVLGVSVMITDPPYSEHVHESATSTGTNGAGTVDRDFGFAHLSPELRDHLAALSAACARWSVVFSDFEGIHGWYESWHSANVEYLRTVPWVRWSQPQITGDRPPSGAEAVLIGHSQRVGPRGGVRPLAKHWNGSGGLTHFGRRCLRGAEKHPTEKPLDLALDIVSWFSDPGETVFDPCAGAGTISLAARLLGRHSLAYELSELWATAAERRVRDPLSPRDLTLVTSWCESTWAEAEREISSPVATPGTIRRAAARKADVLAAVENSGIDWRSK